MNIVPPFRGELGIMIRFHVPAVYALDRPVTVAHERGYEALYPDCQRVIVPKRPDPRRGWTYALDDAFVSDWKAKLMKDHPGATLVMPDDRAEDRAERRFVPEPFVAQRGDAPAPDVIVAPRKRKVGVERNWDAWPHVATGLRAAGLRVFAAGAQAASYEVAADEKAWDYERTLDACIEAMRQAKLVVSTDAGLAHLAVLCGTPLLLIGAEDGKAAPGTFQRASMRKPQPMWHIRMDEYYNRANHTGSLIELMEDGWRHPAAVVQRAEELCK